MTEFSKEEVVTLLGFRTKAAAEAKKRFAEFVADQGGHNCVCYTCFTIWLAENDSDLLRQIGDSWCYLVNFIEGEGEVRGIWTVTKGKPSKAEEVQIVEAFIKLCIESMTPDLFDVLVDEIVPALEKYRHIKVRSVKELGEEMGAK